MNVQLTASEFDTLHRALYVLGIWSKIKDFLEAQQDYRKPDVEQVELKKIEKTLFDSDTQAICMFLVYKFQEENGEPLTLGTLARVLEPSNADASAMKSAQAKVKTVLERISNYNLVSYEIVKKDRQEVYQISPREKLVSFFKESFIKDYEEIFFLDKK